MLGTAAVLWLGGQRAITHDLSRGSLLLFLGYMAMMQTHVTTLLTTYTTLQGTFASADRVLEMLAPIPSNPDSPFAIAAVADEIWGQTPDSGCGIRRRTRYRPTILRKG